MKKAIIIFVVIVIFIGLIVLKASVFVVDEMHFAVVTQFGQHKKTVSEPGLYVKTPFIQAVNYLPKQVLQWQGAAREFVTKDKTYINSNTWARWRIVDPLRFYQRLRTEDRGHGTLDDQIESAAKTVIASHDLIELVRNSNRKMGYNVAELRETQEEQREIMVGREAMCRQILEGASRVVSKGKDGTLESEYGMELIDVQISTVIYVAEVQHSVYARMSAERKKIASRYRSEGQEKANAIIGVMRRDLAKIKSEGYEAAEKLRGEGDAEALTIYAEAYGKDIEFYQFWRTLKTYEESIDVRTTLILSLDNEYLKLLGNPPLKPPQE